MGARASREEWRKRIAAWERSGLSKREFADQEGLNASTLAWWRWRLRSEVSADKSAETHTVDDGAETPLVGFVELEPASQTAPGLELYVGDVRLVVPNGFDGWTLHRVLDLLEVL